MKNNFKGLWLAALAASMVVLAFSTCKLGGNEEEGEEGIAGEAAIDVDWTNYNTAGSYCILIRNSSNTDLIAFRNSLTTANMLGGVKKNEASHGFQKTLISENSDFSIIFLTVDQYNSNKGNLEALEFSPFTRIYAMYNANGTNDVPFEVSSYLGGNNKLIINNLTGMNMELRQDSPRGIALGYSPYETNNTTLHMVDGSYMVYPVFKKYNALRDEIISIYPRAGDNLPLGDEFSFSGGKEVTINAANYTGNTNLSSGAAFLLIKNDSANGFTVYHGTTQQKTESGITTINAGEQRTFTIFMPEEDDGDMYADFDTFSGWKLVNQGVREISIPSITTNEGKIAADYRYTVTVTGNWNENFPTSVTVTDPVKSENKVTNFANSDL